MACVEESSSDFVSLPLVDNFHTRQTNFYFAKAQYAYSRLSEEEMEGLRELRDDWERCSADGLDNENGW